MVIPRAHAHRLITLGLAAPGSQHRAPDGRAYRELLRPGSYRVDHFLDDPHEVGKPEPRAFTFIGVSDRRARGPRPVPSYDVLTEPPPGRTKWRRKKSLHSQETDEERAERRERELLQGQAGKDAPKRRRCPNCGRLTNAQKHCVDSLTVSLKENPPPPLPSVLGRDRPYQPPKFRRVCRVCGALSNDQECCGLRTVCR